MDSKERLEPSDHRVLISVPHVVQYYHWDCGLACASMVLKYFGESCDNVYTSDLDHLQCGESVWTIDLAYLLKRHHIKHRLYTRTLGINQEYSKQPYYCKNYVRDVVRINKIFEEAGENDVVVEKRSVTLEDILKHMKNHNLAICLVDWNHMECIWCDKTRRPCLCCLRLCSSRYQGHFIVLCGFNREKSHIYYKNPSAYEQDICCSRFDQFDKARKSYGTDEDILFTYKKTTHTTV